MASNGGNSSSALAVENVNDFLEIFCKDTFRWAVAACTVDGKNDLTDLKHTINLYDQRIPDLPSMAWTFKLSSSSRLEYCSTDARYVGQPVHFHHSEVSFRYDCKVHNGAPPPIYVIRVSALGAKKNDDHGLDKEIHKSELRNNIFGQFLLGKLPFSYGTLPKVNDVFVFEITLEFYRPSAQVFGVGELKFYKKPNENTQKGHALNMLESGRHSDVKVISMDGQEFHAHKLFLRAGCDVFEAMFRHDMTETRSGVITLDDMSANAVKFLLHFIYSSELLPISFNENGSEDEKENASIEEVAYLASKYGLTELIKCLDERMKTFCNGENALRLLKLCKKYSLEKGMKAVFEFVVKNHVDVLEEFVLATLQNE